MAFPRIQSITLTLKVVGAGELFSVEDHGIGWIYGRIISISDDAEVIGAIECYDWWRAAEARTGAHWRNENRALNLEGGCRLHF